MFPSIKIGEDLAARKRRHPEMWQIGELLADDRFEVLRGEDREWSLSMADDYMREVGLDAIGITVATARWQNRELDTESLTTIGIACGISIETPLRNYIGSGYASVDRKEILDHRVDYDAGRQLAETTLHDQEDPWLRLAPFIGARLPLQIDMRLGLAFDTTGTFRTSFASPGVALSAFKARMAELVRGRLSEGVDMPPGWSSP